MSLFLVNRYLGEEDNGSVSKESRSQALLAKLQQKAKEKQKQSLTEQRQKQPPKEQTEQQDGRKKRKADKEGSDDPRQHKKKKSEGVPLFVSDSDRHDAPVKEEKKKKKKTGADKKQKKKKSGVCACFCSLCRHQTGLYIHILTSFI
ncbi:ATP-dependent RNA helicase DDX51-like [Plectropomus leopardus]|uniref:ATP-dependent RNA helicase DDX51-like n=1 Tax=Plectropomus leopardus TaxID=160734 RepID=UPI001C4CFE78|nr:ATP-dependent RNA helicase DDX51-like [Plectropomus leopardus]